MTHAKKLHLQLQTTIGARSVCPCRGCLRQSSLACCGSNRQPTGTLARTRGAGTFWQECWRINDKAGPPRTRAEFTRAIAVERVNDEQTLHERQRSPAPAPPAIPSLATGADRHPPLATMAHSMRAHPPKNPTPNTQ